MTVTLIFLLVIFILALLFLPFMRQIAKDKIELSQTSLPQKFEILFAAINASLMQGKGELTTFDDDLRSVNMLDEDPTALLTGMYCGLSMNQKRSIANLMYIIGSADGSSENAVIKKNTFGMQLTTMRVK